MTSVITRPGPDQQIVRMAMVQAFERLYPTATQRGPRSNFEIEIEAIMARHQHEAFTQATVAPRRRSWTRGLLTRRSAVARRRSSSDTAVHAAK